MYTHTHTHTHTHFNYIYIHTCIHTYTYIHNFNYIHTCMHITLVSFIYVYVLFCKWDSFFQLLCVFLQLRRERIAERMKALQEMVPSANKVHFCLFSPSMNNIYCFPFILHYHFYCVCISKYLFFFSHFNDSMYLFFIIIYIVYAYPCIYSVIYAVGQSIYAR